MKEVVLAELEKSLLAGRCSTHDASSALLHTIISYVKQVADTWLQYKWRYIPYSQQNRHCCWQEGNIDGQTRTMYMAAETRASRLELLILYTALDLVMTVIFVNRIIN